MTIRRKVIPFQDAGFSARGQILTDASSTLHRSVLAALHWSLPHSIYIAQSLIRINAGSFGGEMIN
jgi:hypothetical protein